MHLFASRALDHLWLLLNALWCSRNDAVDAVVWRGMSQNRGAPHFLSVLGHAHQSGLTLGQNKDANGPLVNFKNVYSPVQSNLQCQLSVFSNCSVTLGDMK